MAQTTHVAVRYRSSQSFIAQLTDTLSTVNSLDWRERPETAHFGPASWQSGLLSLLTAIFVKPVLGALTLIGMVVNRFSPDTLQRVRLDGIDGPLGLIRPLPGTDVARVDLPHCPAEWVIAPQARESTSLIVYFHGSALVTLGTQLAPALRQPTVGGHRRQGAQRRLPAGAAGQHRGRRRRRVGRLPLRVGAGVRARADRAGR